MPKRNTQWRRHQILEQLSATGEVTVEALAQALATSEVTIRKDLTALEASGLLLRRYGGAVPMPQEILHDAHPQASPNKRAIALAAATLIHDHNRIVIDSGNTTSALLPALSAKQGLVVMTNALSIAHALTELENEPTLLMPGGTWDAHSDAFQGRLAEQVLRAYNFDQLFIGAAGLDIERGTTTFNELYSLSQVMAEVSREVIVMAESNKLGRRINNVELPWKSVDVLVTDKGLPDNAKQKIEQQGVQVICVPTNTGESQCVE